MKQLTFLLIFLGAVNMLHAQAWAKNGKPTKDAEREFQRVFGDPMGFTSQETLEFVDSIRLHGKYVNKKVRNSAANSVGIKPLAVGTYSVTYLGSTDATLLEPDKVGYTANLYLKEGCINLCWTLTAPSPVVTPPPPPSPPPPPPVKEEDLGYFPEEESNQEQSGGYFIDGAYDTYASYPTWGAYEYGPYYNYGCITLRFVVITQPFWCPVTRYQEACPPPVVLYRACDHCGSREHHPNNCPQRQEPICPVCKQRHDPREDCPRRQEPLSDYAWNQKRLLELQSFLGNNNLVASQPQTQSNSNESSDSRNSSGFNDQTNDQTTASVQRSDSSPRSKPSTPPQRNPSTAPTVREKPGAYYGPHNGGSQTTAPHTERPSNVRSNPSTPPQRTPSSGNPGGGRQPSSRNRGAGQ